MEVPIEKQSLGDKQPIVIDIGYRWNSSTTIRNHILFISNADYAPKGAVVQAIPNDFIRKFPETIILTIMTHECSLAILKTITFYTRFLWLLPSQSHPKLEGLPSYIEPGEPIQRTPRTWWFRFFKRMRLASNPKPPQTLHSVAVIKHLRVVRGSPPPTATPHSSNSCNNQLGSTKTEKP